MAINEQIEKQKQCQITSNKHIYQLTLWMTTNKRTHKTIETYCTGCILMKLECNTHIEHRDCVQLQTSMSETRVYGMKSVHTSARCSTHANTTADSDEISSRSDAHRTPRSTCFVWHANTSINTVAGTAHTTKCLATASIYTDDDPRSGSERTVIVWKGKQRVVTALKAARQTRQARWTKHTN